MATRNLYGYGGDDSLSGQDDVLSGNQFANELYGSGGNDTLSGHDDNDTLFGGYGNDTLYGDQGDDWLWGNTGDDLLWGDAGDDTLVGGDGNDTAIYQGSVQGVVASLMTHSGKSGDAAGDTFDGIENLIGTAQDDELTGDDGVNTLTGRGGSLGDSAIEAVGEGALDRVQTDTLLGLNGDDELDGGNGRDILDGGKGMDKMLGGSDDDTYIVNR